MKRTVLLFACVCLLGGLLAACGEPAAEEAVPAGETTVSDEAASLIDPVNAEQSADEAAAAAPDEIDEELREQGLNVMSSDRTGEIVAEINNRRAEAGCPAVTPQPLLAIAAQGHAEDMAVRNYLNHTNLDGLPFSQRISNTGYAWLQSAENIAAGVGEPGSVVQMWMDSPQHRTNMLNCEMLEMGIGYAFQDTDQADVVLPNGSVSGPFMHYWVLNLALPAQ